MRLTKFIKRDSTKKLKYIITTIKKIKIGPGGPEPLGLHLGPSLYVYKCHLSEVSFILVVKLSVNKVKEEQL